MKLDIIYEDKDILVCYKPAGIATQTASFSSTDMVSLIKNHLAKSRKEKSPYVGIIHRLDQPVSGLLVFAKNKKAAADLSKQIQDGNANKDYLAMCYQVPTEKEGRLKHYLMKNPVTKLAEVMEEEKYLNLIKKDKEESAKFTKQKIGRKEPGIIGTENYVNEETDTDRLKNRYKKAVLDYKIEKELGDASVLKIHLQTGRFHQIRAQFAAIGNALLGDMKYGSVESKNLSMEKQVNKIALCAYRLVLKHPGTGKEMEFILSEENLPDWYRCNT